MGTVRRYVYACGHASAEEERELRMTWDEFVGDYVDHLVSAKRTDKHVYDVRNTLTRFAGLFSARGVRPAQVTRRLFGVVLDEYQSQGVSTQTINHAIAKVTAAYKWHYQQEHFAADKLHLFPKRQEPREERRRKKFQPVTLDEIGIITHGITEAWSPEFAPASRFRSEEARTFFRVRDTCMTLWLAETGCRVGEMCQVRRDDLDLEKRCALIRNTKNGDDRYVFWTQEFADSPLAEWLAIRDGLEVYTDTLFVSELGLPLNPYAWGRGWNRYVKRAGIERRIRRHDLRHFSSTAHDRVDKDLSKKIIGHHTDQAHAIYSHREMAELRAAHDAANPIGLLLAQARADAEAWQAASEAKAPRKKVYTKTRGQG